MKVGEGTNGQSQQYTQALEEDWVGREGVVEEGGGWGDVAC